MDATEPGEPKHEHEGAYGVAAEPDAVSARMVVGFAVSLRS